MCLWLDWIGEWLHNIKSALLSILVLVYMFKTNFIFCNHVRFRGQVTPITTHLATRSVRLQV